ncbi:MAG: hypothetical protein STSR0008_07590 [Ignavibacterium sp.]
MTLKKWKLKKLNSDDTFSDGAKIVLQHRLNIIIKKIKLYLKNPSIENLHQVRISIRRIRYSLEVFINCFDNKIYAQFYDLVTELQDFTGKGRDLDIIKNYINEKFGNTKKIFQINKNIDLDKNQLEENIKLELLKFIHCDLTKKFSELIN